MQWRIGHRTLALFILLFTVNDQKRLPPTTGCCWTLPLKQSSSVTASAAAAEVAEEPAGGCCCCWSWTCQQRRIERAVSMPSPWGYWTVTPRSEWSVRPLVRTTDHLTDRLAVQWRNQNGNNAAISVLKIAKKPSYICISIGIWSWSLTVQVAEAYKLTIQHLYLPQNNYVCKTFCVFRHSPITS